jgi:hypothetical protein
MNKTDLLALATQIKSETGRKRNTAVRVGNALEKIIQNAVNTEWGTTASGTDTYTATVSDSGIDAYTANQIFVVKFTNGNTGAATFNYNGLGALPIHKVNNTELSSGDIQDGQVLLLFNNGSAFQIVGSVGSTGGGGPTAWVDLTGDPEDNSALMTLLTTIGSDANTYTDEQVADPTNISQDSTHRFVSDAEKAAWNAAENNAKSYADGLVVGLWDDRGTYDASGGTYPSSGGSGSAGAIKKGDIWTISVAGTLPTGQVVEVGDTVRALIDTPGNTQANWAIQQNNIGFVPANDSAVVKLTGDQTVAGIKNFSSSPVIPTATVGDNTTKAASTAFVAAAIAALVNSSPSALDTLNELAAALGNDANFATTITNALALKAPLASPALTGNPTAPTQSQGDNSTKVSTTAYVDALGGTKLDKNITANRQTSSYTLVIGDAGKLVEMNNASANNLTVPPNSSVAFPTGTQILISQYGAGQTTVVAGSGVTIRSASNYLKLSSQYSGATLVKIASDEWYLFGDLSA